MINSIVIITLVNLITFPFKLFNFAKIKVIQIKIIKLFSCFPEHSMKHLIRVMMFSHSNWLQKIETLSWAKQTDKKNIISFETENANKRSKNWKRKKFLMKFGKLIICKWQLINNPVDQQFIGKKNKNLHEEIIQQNMKLQLIS